MLKSKSPPINLDEYLEGQHRHFMTYWEGAREIGIAYWSFVSLAKEANATIRMGRYVIVDNDVVNEYITLKILLMIVRRSERHGNNK